VNRRSFVKTCVGVAGAGALAASGLSMAAGLAIPRRAGGALIRYYGAHRVGGPAPRGVPLIPITVEDGKFVGRITIPSFEDPSKEINVLDWYKYCGHSGAPGLVPNFTNDNTLLYNEKDLYKVVKPWFDGKYGQPVTPDDFPANSFGASFQWRSKGQQGTNVLSGVIIRANPAEVKYVTSTVAPAKPLASQAEYDYVVKNVHHVDPTTKNHFIAVSTFCTHFCCVPGYKEAEALARPRNAWDNMFCTCHNSNYNYRQPVAYTFSPETTAASNEGVFDPLLKSQQA
jgi:Rieske Fe-S protein